MQRRERLTLNQKPDDGKAISTLGVSEQGHSSNLHFEQKVDAEQDSEMPFWSERSDAV